MLYRQVQVCCCTSVYAFGVQVSGFSVQECGFVAVQVWVCCCTGEWGFAAV